MPLGAHSTARDLAIWITAASVGIEGELARLWISLPSARKTGLHTREIVRRLRLRHVDNYTTHAPNQDDAGTCGHHFGGFTSDKV
jgi:hypothetical protein